jgi:hypothetical protein
MRRRRAQTLRGWRKKEAPEMDTTLWITVAVVIVIALVVYRYGREIGLKFKGWGVETALSAKGDAEAAKGPPGGRNVSIGGNAEGNTIVTGDGNKLP